LHNLLNNGVRFTQPPGEVRLDVELHADELWLKVQDTGIGIAPENLERIFDRFRQVEAHMTRQYGGMGLGLSIARGLVEAHGGRLWATSPGLGQGATFIMALPLRSPSFEQRG
jgi:signal transduction histidine kinase